MPSRRKHDLGAGDLPHFVEVQHYRGERDALGEYEEEGWEALRQTWARVEPLQGWEYWQAAQMKNQGTWKATFRYRVDHGMTAGMRLVYQGRVLYFSEAPRDLSGSHEWLEVMCRETPPTQTPP